MHCRWCDESPILRRVTHCRSCGWEQPLVADGLCGPCVRWQDGDHTVADADRAAELLAAVVNRASLDAVMDRCDVCPDSTCADSYLSTVRATLITEGPAEVFDFVARVAVGAAA